MEARDVDGPGVNSEVSYDKAGEDRDKFSVDKDTGIVTVAPGSHHTPTNARGRQHVTHPSVQQLTGRVCCLGP